ncbi:MAG: alcohol dehydrogenase catalytic domain-containing protein [Candidatus Limnocylindria bacterium]
MRAVRFHAPGNGLRIEDVPLPQPLGTQVRVRVAGCGVCHTDLHVVDGAQTRVVPPVTLGHEVAGWVDAYGPEVTGAPPIDTPVVVFGGWGCGDCRECRGGAEQRCVDAVAPGFQADGGYASALLVPHPRHLVILTGLDPAHAAPLADAGITPYRAVTRADPWLKESARVLVIGCGALGQFALQYLRLLPAHGSTLAITVRDRIPARLERAMALGADGVQLADADEPVTGSFDVAFDFVGSSETLRQATGALAPDGLLVLVGEAGADIRFGFEHVPIESWLTTVAWGSAGDLRAVVRLADEGRITWSTELLPLEDAAESHRRLRAGDVDGRLVLVPQAEGGRA